MNKKHKDLVLKCNCIGGKGCGAELVVLDFGDKDCEINGIYLNAESIKELVNFLLKLTPKK